MEGVKQHVYSDEFLNFTLENTAMHILHGLTVLQQCHNVMPIFRFEANDKKWLGKRKSERRL